MEQAIDRWDEPTTETRFWGGFAVGALIGTAATVATVMVTQAISGRRDRRVVRLQESMQIARPVDEVFRAWSDFGSLPRVIGLLESVRIDGNTSSWRATVAGRPVKWNAMVTQNVRNEAIGWKSVSGPKHTGRIAFSPLGDQTLVHITMNYAPPFGRLAGLLQPGADKLEDYLQEALRDFKLALEGDVHRPRPAQPAPTAHWRDHRATGTGDFSPAASPVDYTHPPDQRYPINQERDRGR